MATNEILPFATSDTGTNLLTQKEYASDNQRIIGHQPGIARSKLENKVLRQASLMAAGLAEFIADNQSNNITDNLTPQTIANYLQAALSALGLMPATEDRAGVVELATTAEAQALASAVVALTPARLADAFKGANQSLSASGYQKLPGGLIIQWLRTNVATPPGESTSGAWPIAFPNALLFGMANVNGTADNATTYSAAFSYYSTTTTWRYWNHSGPNSITPGGCWVIGIGY